MIAYRAEIWCDTNSCTAGYGKGTPHDDLQSLPGLARNLEKGLIKEGLDKRIWSALIARPARPSARGN